MAKHDPTEKELAESRFAPDILCDMIWTGSFASATTLLEHGVRSFDEHEQAITLARDLVGGSVPDLETRTKALDFLLDHELVDIEGTIAEDEHTLATLCCTYGVLDTARQLKRRGADFQRPGPGGFGCLHQAASRGDDGSMVRLLLTEEFGLGPPLANSRDYKSLGIANKYGGLGVAGIDEKSLPEQANGPRRRRHLTVAA